MAGKPRSASHDELSAAKERRRPRRSVASIVFDSGPRALPELPAPVLAAAMTGLMNAKRSPGREEAKRRARALLDGFESMKTLLGDKLVLLWAAWIMNRGLPRGRRCDPFARLNNKVSFLEWHARLPQKRNHREAIAAATRALPELFRELARYPCTCGPLPALPRISFDEWPDTPADRCFWLLGYVHGGKKPNTMQRELSQDAVVLRQVASPREELLRALETALEESGPPQAAPLARSPRKSKRVLH